MFHNEQPAGIPALITNVLKMDKALDTELETKSEKVCDHSIIIVCGSFKFTWLYRNHNVI